MSAFGQPAWADVRSELDELTHFFRDLLSRSRQTPVNPDIDLQDKFRVLRNWATNNDVTRLAECTGFDRLGVPNFYAVRPSALHPCAIVNSGRGLTRADATLSAMFECFERWAAERPKGLILTSSADALLEQFPSAVVALPAGLSSGMVLPWAVGFDLLSQSVSFIPLKKLIFPYSRDLLDVPLSSHTTGLAAGTDPADTLCAAILEVVERDAVSRLDVHHLHVVDVQDAPEAVRSLLRRFESAAIDVSIVRCPNPFDIPVFYALSRDDRMALSSMFCSGSAAHWDPTEALVRTLTEVTQSRIAFISTLRDDVGPKVLHDMRSDYWLTRSAFESWFSHTSFEPFSTIFRSEASHPANGLAALLARMRDSSAISMLVCAPLRTASGLVCYRVYAPELNELHRAWIE